MEDIVDVNKIYDIMLADCWVMIREITTNVNTVEPVSYTHLDVYKRQVYNY